MTQFNRREFLAGVGALAGVRAGAVSFDPADPIASSAPVRWAASYLDSALAKRGLAVKVTAAGRGAPAAAGLGLPDAAEAWAIAPAKDGVLAAGSDARGLVYALLEAADRVENGQPAAPDKPEIQRPANRVRSVARLFVSEPEDKPWFYDREQWREYLTMLATHRFNRVHLAFGIGYDYTYGEVRDAYFNFTYPFLVDAPGYEVRVEGLSEGERERNLETLRFISDEAAMRGLEFHLGLWNHAYEYPNAPKLTHKILGLRPEIHAAYCRDALRLVLQKCPSITGVTIRTHGEGGVAEGAYELWRTIFRGAAECGRRVEIDLHAKGVNQKMIDTAASTGLPITITPKFWAEHMGLPYHQAAIRAMEAPRPDIEGVFKVSSGSRNFIRYGYADLLTEDRAYRVVHRIWPGTQRMLLWGDPVFAAAASRQASFCGSDGAEWMEPLSFKGRKGSGQPGSRTGYAEAGLAPRRDWEKFFYTYRLWGRLLYNPAEKPESWRPALRKRYGAAAQAVEQALASSSRILPLVLMSHCASAANNLYWPEMYANQSVVDPKQGEPFTDTAEPRVFGNVSPLDPEIFASPNEFVDRMMEGEPCLKYTPVEVAAWLDGLAGNAGRAMAQAKGGGADLDRTRLDVAIVAGLGRFFAAKLRSAVEWAIYDRTGGKSALEKALAEYRKARAAWAELASGPAKVYRRDVTYGVDWWSRGHWQDRLAAIDRDIAEMGKRAPAQSKPDAKLAAPQPRAKLTAHHTPPKSFTPGEPLAIMVESPAAGVRLHYRRVNQAEPWRAVEMTGKAGRWTAAIPGETTRSPFPVQYYFELRGAGGALAMHPGLGADLAGTPYFAVRRA